MRPSKIKAKLRRNAPVLLTTLHFTDPSAYELAGLMGFDGLWMDLEHHGYSVETAGAMMRAARVGKIDIMARMGKGEFMRMGRLLECGAQGIMYPRCESAAEAREVVRWSKFAPLGQRGFDGGNPDMPYCTMSPAEYVQKANQETFVVVQIEDPESLKQVDEIAAVKGVDVIFFGPADFTALSGIPGQFDHPLVHQAIGKIAMATKNAGIHWGMPSGSVERTRQLLDLGARFLAHGADIIWVKQAMEAMQRDFTPLGFTFENQLG
ncbi:MAG TPA: aldolase/citrate lyase family protein, partial [Planctomycetaceae bacterium]|nr:aldolase/citrate lyase family protein [Planctomycetaceae bacterium]